VNIPQLNFNASGAAEFDCITVEHNDFAGEAALLPSFVRWFSAQHGHELVLPGIADTIHAASPEFVHRQHMKRGRTNRRLEAVARDGLGSVLSRNTRQQLAKSIRDFEEFGPLAVTEASNIEEAIAYFEALKSLHIASFSRRGKPHSFRYAYFEVFHRALIERGMPKGTIQLLKISAGARLLGHLYNFRHGNRVYAYQSGFSDADWSLRPGYVCHALAIAFNARQGLTEYDFLAGENRLKESLGETEYELGWHSISRASPIVRLEAVARRVLRRR
jgi:CelD/BcsL family acetyltransferase involved in cellulose biosynthesis